MCHNFSMIEGYVGNSLEVQRLGLCALTTEGLGLIPGWGTNTHKPWPKKREGKKKKDHLSLKAKTETKKKQQQKNTISL